LSLFTSDSITLSQAVTHVAYARKAQSEAKSHPKCEKEQNHSQEELDRRRRKTREKKKHSEQIKNHNKY